MFTTDITGPVPSNQTAFKKKICHNNTDCGEEEKLRIFWYTHKNLIPITFQSNLYICTVQYCTGAYCTKANGNIWAGQPKFE